MNISINPSNTILVSTGEDKTMFVFQLNKTKPENLLVPIGFVPTPDVPTAITWHLEMVFILLHQKRDSELYFNTNLFLDQRSVDRMFTWTNATS